MSDAIITPKDQFTDLVTPEITAFTSLTGGDLKRVHSILAGARLAVIESVDLKNAIKTPEGQISFINCLKRAMETGLSLNPQAQLCALVPHGSVVSYWIMKNGYREFAINSGVVSQSYAITVGENDHFLPPMDTANGIEYEFCPDKIDSGEIIGFLGIARLTAGGTQALYMNANEMKAHREEHSKKSKLTPKAYGEKTIIRRLLTHTVHIPDIQKFSSMDDSDPRDVTPPPHPGTNESLKASLSVRSQEPPRSVTPEPDSEEHREHADAMFHEDDARATG